MFIRRIQGFFRIIKNQRGGDPSPKTPSPPPQTKVTIVGKNEIYNRENLVRPFLVHQVLGPKPPPPLPPPAQKKPWADLLRGCLSTQGVAILDTHSAQVHGKPSRVPREINQQKALSHRRC